MIKTLFLTPLGANTATPVSATSVLCKWISIAPMAANTGILTIGDKTLAIATPTGVIRQIPVPSAVQVGWFEFQEGESPNGIDLNNFMFSTPQTGDRVCVAYDEL